LKYGQGVRNPFTEALCDWTVLMEVATYNERRPMREPLEEVLMAAYEDGVVRDVVVAQSISDSADFWRIRELLSELQGREGGSIKHDVSVPVHLIPEFITEATEAALGVVPGARPVTFGHMGDGNLHFNISQPVGADKAEYLAKWDTMNAAVHALVTKYNGSIAAEHGVGRLKRNLLRDVRSPLELSMMRAVKGAFDPEGIMSPGRFLPDGN
ncbi:MAG: FAD-binding oxidoreductase, partial [Pseudomonadota bacterium]